ncbi:hypothetical protein H8D04_01485 [bacterium]|nr:hypothetical protein [bacterium]
MALNKNKLKQGLIDNFKNIRDNGLSKNDSATGFAKAIVDYSGDAVLPAAANSNITTHLIGQPALQSGILTSFTANDATMGLIATTIVGYVASSFTTFATGTNSGIGLSVMVVPPIFAPVISNGLNGGSIDDVCGIMADVIHTSYSSILFTGTVILSGAAGSPVTGKPIL